jgi:hypothetical protein
MKDNDHGFEVLSSDDVCRIANSNDIPDNAANVVSDAWSAIESGIFGDLIDDFGVANCTDEEDMDSPFDSAQASIHPTLSSLSYNRKGRVGIGSSMVDEFDDVGEQIAYLLIHEHVRSCFVDSISKKKAQFGLDWVFAQIPDEYGRTFNECCDVLRVRPWLIQTRIHFQFYKKGIIFENQMRPETVNLPDIIQCESSYYGGDEGVVLATIAWYLPGVEHKNIAKTKSAVNSIFLLEEKGIMSEHGGYWYTTGRNPFLQEKARKTISWSELWPSNSY